MEQALPVEELATQRLKIMVYSYTLLIKNLMEEGIDVAKVKKASEAKNRPIKIKAAAFCIVRCGLACSFVA